MQIPLGQYAYRRADGVLPSVHLENVFFEKTPTNLKDQVALLTRPTLSLLANVGLGPIRCIFYEGGAFGNQTQALVVSGLALYRVGQTGSAQKVGDVPGTGVVEIACSPTTALIANGGLLLQTDGLTVTSKAFPDNQPVQSVGYINGYFLAVPVDSHRIYYTDLTTGEFDGTRFISAERYADNLSKLIVTSDEVWGMGTDSVEVFVPTGVDTAEQPPLQRVEGRLYEKGVLNPATAVKADNTVYWIGQSDDGGLSLYRGNAVPLQASDAGLSERITRADPAKMTAWVFGMYGHSFYVLGLGDQGTWAVDLATGFPYEWSTLGRDQWRAWLGKGVWNGVVLAGDIDTGAVYRLDPDGLDDAGSPIRQVWTAGAPVDGRPSCANFSLDCAVGQAPLGVIPTINMSFSDDQGRTWQNEGPCPVGVQGDYEDRVRWDRLGQMKPPVRIFECWTTDRIRVRVGSARINDAF